MIAITNERELQDFFTREKALLFFHAQWSDYAVLSKQILAFVERYSELEQRKVPFFFGEFEGALLPLAQSLATAGVSNSALGSGAGSLSFFRHGQHVRTIRSVVGDGLYEVWKTMDEIFGRPSA